MQGTNRILVFMFLLSLPFIGHAIEVTQCGVKAKMTPGDVCYIGNAWFCSYEAKNCSEQVIDGKSLEPTGLTCYGLSASCDNQCWSGNKHICRMPGSQNLVNFAELKPVLELAAAKENENKQTVDALAMVRDFATLEQANLHYYDASWWIYYKNPGPQRSGCPACIESLNLFSDIVGSLAWADPEAGPFVSAGMTLTRFITEKVFAPSYTKTMQQIRRNENELLSSFKDTLLHNELDKAMGPARAANNRIQSVYNTSWDFAAEGQARSELIKEFSDVGSPYGLERLFTDQNSLYEGRLAVPQNMAVIAPSNTYALGPWLYVVNTYLLESRVTAVLNAYPVRCVSPDKEESGSCVTEFTDKTFEELLRESWIKNSNFIAKIIEGVFDPANGFIARAGAYEQSIQDAMAKRLSMIVVSENPVLFGSCHSNLPNRSLNPVDHASAPRVGHVVTDSGFSKDMGLSNFLNEAMLDVAGGYSLACSPNDDFFKDTENIVAANTIQLGGDKDSATRDARLWAAHTLNRYWDSWGIGYLPTLRKNVESWEALAREFCKAVPVDSKSKSAEYCRAQGKTGV